MYYPPNALPFCILFQITEPRRTIGLLRSYILNPSVNRSTVVLRKTTVKQTNGTAQQDNVRGHITMSQCTAAECGRQTQENCSVFWKVGMPYLLDTGNSTGLAALPSHDKDSEFHPAVEGAAFIGVVGCYRHAFPISFILQTLDVDTLRHQKINYSFGSIL